MTSIIMPKKIDVNVSSLIDLKAELFRKTEEKKLKVKRSEASTTTSSDLEFARSFSAGKKPLADREKLSRKAAAEKSKGKKSEVSSAEIEEEARRLQKSKSSLEAKAKLYDRLCQGEEIFGDERNEDARCLVNFNQKNRQEKAEESDSDSYVEDGATHPQEEWVDYTDFLGRTRRCMKKDLPAFLEADTRLRTGPRKNQSGRDLEEGSEGFSEKTELLSEDMKRELERQNWESEEAHRGPLHYQHVLNNEAREHGVAYMQFSQDEVTRQQQMKELDQMRKQTIESRNRNERMKEKRKQMMASRLAKVRERKKLRLEEGQEDPLLISSSDEEEIETDPSRLAAIPLPEESAAEEAEKRKAEEAERQRKRLVHIRPWDEDKKIMSQETWIQKKREQRPKEFAPPSFY